MSASRQTPNVQLPPGIQSPPADADGSLTGFRRVDCPLRFRIVEALSSYREDHRDWCGAWRTHQSCSSSRRATLIPHLFTDCEPTPEFFWISRLASLLPPLFSLTSAAEVRQTSSRSSLGTLDLQPPLPSSPSPPPPHLRSLSS